MGRKRREQEVLGMNPGTAAHRLRKLIMFQLIQETGKDICYRCGVRIESPDILSIEHKIPWLNKGPEYFWDLNNIAFSHLPCNRREAPELPNTCSKGHTMDEQNTVWDRKRSFRRCKACHREHWHKFKTERNARRKEKRLRAKATAKRDANIMALRKDGLSFREIAKALDVCYVTAFNVAKKNDPQ